MLAAVFVFIIVIFKYFKRGVIITACESEHAVCLHPTAPDAIRELRKG